MDVAALTLLALALPFVAALVAPLLTRLLGHNAAWILALFPAAIVLHFMGFWPEVSRGEVVTGGYEWIPSFNVSFSWLIDGLSLTFVLLIAGIGALIVLYSGGYLKGHPQQGRFFSFILMFMGSMLGLVVSDSFLMLFVFWELTSITSFLLIGFDHSREAARRAALQALVVTGGGGLFLLAGLLIIWNVTGVTQLSLLTSFGPEMRESPFYLAALLLVLGGAFTKSAQFPFHFWLPNAMEAPTPVSAYLHSATMVKAGVYLLMRLNPVLGGTPEWQMLLPLFGGTTLIIGAVLACRQTDLKLMLAYTTMASLGLLVMLTGLGFPHAIEAAALYLVAHSLFKGALFMVAGIIDHETGTRDVTKLGGLRSAMLLTFVIALAAALSMGGLPPFFGFLAKEEIYYALPSFDRRAMVFASLAILGNALMFAVAFAVALKPFIGAKIETPKSPHEAPLLLWLGPALLAAKGLSAALLSNLTHELVSTPMATAIAGEPRQITISAIPDIGMPLVLSFATIALGIVCYLNLARLRAFIATILSDIGWGPDRGFDQFMRNLVRFSVALTRRLQSGRLEVYMTATFVLVAAVLLGAPIYYGELPRAPFFAGDVPLHELAIMAIAVIGLFAVVLAADRLTAIVSLGIQGFAVAVIFLLYGAPDLAFTQFMIETLSVVVLALVMTRLRLSPSDHRPLGQRLPDFTIALACGIGFGLMLLKVTGVPFDASLTDFFNLYSKTVAHGANVVNVIIVDFRGTDTLGEIAVVMVTGLAILSLVRLRAGSLRRIADNDPDAEDGA
ncbi:putative monovalent cation/H+ antiporter subunit A [Ensifer sp. T173]|jgi:multicomponent Na+:H+ antiporter subunit A|uniref:Monovalent cation/H+ antiporter subunit A n=1 Tax=Ensifer canadensis TaxID=555315 RepID=A0AAW4FSN8_9HYPH|nr:MULTISPECIES: putative monovalent cation/H+ antiporter subunit A [Ensifer]AHK43756.1 Na+/H+ antiporter [Ensifer adhaerens OV14]MDP9628000.1 multicomponent Na+:H+ antiporter subunit A [Ensifer adhaerens]KQU72168.1 cation:proton antiporter [Ensifer sp. Root31]KQW84520.1 cation:proton antiporter [Ensifer sp. Root127]KQY71759.1 cation:proton antiporter [Ensifer sp. Root142]